ncbi:MAG: transcription elongation factor GreA [Nitrospirales bacterium]
MKIPMTQKGYESLKSELHRIRKEDRPKNIQAIAEAREHGDLRENAEYKAAKEEQQFIATRIAEIEYKLSEAEVIEVTPGPTDTVVFGATVLMVDMESNEEKQYRLVGQEEADLKTGSISVQSPIGRGLIGHKTGDVVEIKRPAGTIEYEIQKIWFEEL